MALAWTNQAAASIAGRTMHAWFGVAPGFTFDKEDLLRRVHQNSSLCNLLRGIKVIVIDEASFLKARVLDSIYLVMRYVAPGKRKSCIPLGGRQLILAGDP